MNILSTTGSHFANREELATKKGCSILIFATLLASCGKTESTRSPEEYLRQGWTHFRLQEFDAADHDFSEASMRSSDAIDQNRVWLLANYGRGLVASLGRNDPQAAQRFLENVIDGDAGGDMAAWASLALVRDRHIFGRADAMALKKQYAAIVTKYPTNAAAEEAFMYQVSLLVQTFTEPDAREAVQQIAAWTQTHPAGKLQTALYALLSRAHETLHQYPEALADSINSLDSKENDPQNPYQSNILEYYRIGMMAQYDVGDFATARTYYQKFLKEYPRDQRAFTVALMLRQLDLNEAEIRRGKPVTGIAELGGTQ